jgi:hypothetical protein
MYGSPPPAWGIPGRKLQKSCRCCGSPPPAWGILLPPSVPIVLNTVHPHQRGEYEAITQSDYGQIGSPPPAWGILMWCRGGGKSKRFTPTSVGNTSDTSDFLTREYGSPPPAWGIRSRSRYRSVISSVHPHQRGEYPDRPHQPHRPIGSPPPAWGIRLAARPLGQNQRFTPTSVGNTFRISNAVFRSAVHPHQRGEYTSRMPHFKPFRSDNSCLCVFCF